MAESDTSVLIVGGGPAGLVAAITLAGYGVDCLVVEQRVEPSTLPRATVVSLRSMELFRSWGLEPWVRNGSLDVEWRLWVCETLAAAATGVGLPVGVPSREQCEVLSPTTPACVPQDHLEALLLAHLEDFPSARVERGVEVLRLDMGSARTDPVSVTTRDVGTGATRTLRARYVIAADGAHSSIRDALGVAMRGSDHLHESVSVLFRAPLWDVVGPHRYGIYWTTHPEAGGNLIPAGLGDRWIYAIEWDPQRERLADYTPERVTRLIRLATGVSKLEPVVERIGPVTFAAMLADRFRASRVFLVGDAAHRVTPRGGTGMNSAIADGYDIGWKLAWVLEGWADAALLETYEAERRPAVEHNLVRSADPDGSVREAGDEVHADVGGRLKHAWVAGATRPTSTLDLIGPALTLFVGTASTWSNGASTLDAALPLAVRHLDPFTARSLGILGHGALLCRPDGVPAAMWNTDADARHALDVAIASFVNGGDSFGDPRRRGQRVKATG